MNPNKKHLKTMLILGNSAGIICMLLISPFFTDWGLSLISSGYEHVNDEGDKKLDELAKTVSWIFYVMPIISLNIVILLLHFVFKRIIPDTDEKALQSLESGSGKQ